MKEGEACSERTAVALPGQTYIPAYSKETAGC